MDFAGYVTVCVQLYCVSCHCLTLHVSAYMAIFRCIRCTLEDGHVGRNMLCKTVEGGGNEGTMNTRVKMACIPVKNEISHLTNTSSELVQTSSYTMKVLVSKQYIVITGLPIIARDRSSSYAI
jgi:hypothetical protein